MVSHNDGHGPIEDKDGLCTRTCRQIYVILTGCVVRMVVVITGTLRPVDVWTDLCLRIQMVGLEAIGLMDVLGGLIIVVKEMCS